MDKYTELNRLKELLDNGLITEEEFAAEKNKLFNPPAQADQLTNLKVELDKWRTLAIITIFLSAVFGVIGLICNNKAREAFYRGDYELARSKNETTKIMFWVSIGINALILLLMMWG